MNLLRPNACLLLCFVTRSTKDPVATTFAIDCVCRIDHSCCFGGHRALIEVEHGRRGSSRNSTRIGVGRWTWPGSQEQEYLRIIVADDEGSQQSIDGCGQS